jgi:hypothetical protein
VALLDDPEARSRMGRAGRRRVLDELAWKHQEGPYVGVFDRLVGIERTPVVIPAPRVAADASVVDALVASPRDA